MVVTSATLTFPCRGRCSVARMNRDAPATPATPRGPFGTRHRAIGPLGTAARIGVGGLLLGSVTWGHARGGVDLGAWLIGLAVLPGLTIALVRRRAARRPDRLDWLTGPLGHPVTAAAFLTLYATTWYAPSIDVLSDAVLVFAGTTMLVAARRGDAGCELLAVSNWVLRRNDRVGCILFEPVDRIEGRVTKSPAAADVEPT